MQGITSEWLLEKINKLRQRDASEIRLIKKEALTEAIKHSECKIKLLVGAGDIGAEVEIITKALQDES